MREKITDLIPVGIIVFITASAFVAGFYQNTYSERANSLQQDASFHQQVSTEIWGTVYRLFNDETRLLLAAQNYQTMAENLLIDYLNFAETLTEQETQSYLDRIGYNYRLMEYSLEVTWSYSIYHHFERVNESKAFVLDVYPDLNYVCDISQQIYFQNDPSIRVQGVNAFFNESLVETDVIAPEDNYIIQVLADNQYMPKTINHPTLSWLDILYSKIIEETNLAHQLTIQANRVEQIASRMAMGVSITTVASILAVAMSNRLYKKDTTHHVSRLRADILNDESLIVPKKDKLTMFVLITTAVIAVIGLFWPLYLSTVPLDTTKIKGGSLQDLIVPPTPTDIPPPVTVTVAFTTVPEWSVFGLTVFMGLVTLVILCYWYRKRISNMKK